MLFFVDYGLVFTTPCLDLKSACWSVIFRRPYFPHYDPLYIFGCLLCGFMLVLNIFSDLLPNCTRAICRSASRDFSRLVWWWAPSGTSARGQWLEPSACSGPQNFWFFSWGWPQASSGCRCYVSRFDVICQEARQHPVKRETEIGCIFLMFQIKRL